MNQELNELFTELAPYKYCIQRNFENLPQSYVVGSHMDIDLFTSDEDKERVVEICGKSPLPIDVRSPSDLYYPELINDLLLKDMALIDELYKVPNTHAYFLSLYYHNAVHKEDNPYRERLVGLFLNLFSPVKCVDEGVGYYVDSNTGKYAGEIS